MPVTCNLHGKQSLHQETVQLTFRPIWITVVTIVMNVGFILGANLCTEVFDIERLDDMITSGDANVILCPNMFSRYYDSYKYPSTIMHGLAIYEGLGCIRLLLARLVVDPKVGKTPIFILSCLTCVTIAAYLWTMANTIIFVIDYDVLNAAAAISSNESQAMQQAVEYRFKSMITIVSLHFSMLMTIAVILLRMQPFGRAFFKSSQFIVICVLIGIYVICAFAQAYFGWLVFSVPFWWTSKYYPIFGLATLPSIIIPPVINVWATTLFAREMATAVSTNLSSLMYELVIKSQGFRWLMTIGFSIYYTVVAISLACGITAPPWIVVFYHTVPYYMYLVLYSFVDGSYRTARNILQQYISTKEASVVEIQLSTSNVKSPKTLIIQ